MNQKGNMWKAVTGVVFFTLIGKLLGFLREVLLSYFFGATGISDAYLISQTIPGTIFQLIGVGMTTCFVSVYVSLQKEKGKKEAFAFTNKVVTLVMGFSTLVMIVVWIDTPLFVKLFASGFTGETFQYAVVFTRIGILSLYFSSIIYVYNSFLQVNDIFWVTGFAAIPNSLMIMLSIYLGAKYNLWLLSIGSTLAVGVQMIFLVAPARKLGLRHRLNFGWNDPYVKSFFALMGPVILGVSVNEFNTLVDRTVASQVAVGAISALTYAASLINLVNGGLVQPVATVCFPKITSAVSDGKESLAADILNEAMTVTLNFLIPITAGIMLYSKQIANLLFGRGMFDATASELTSIAIFYYAMGICFVGIRELLSRYYYAHKNSKTPMINSTIGLVINIAGNLILSRFLGVGGLALSSSLSALITVVLLIRSRKTLSNQRIYVDRGQIIRSILAAALALGCSYFVYGLLPGEETWRFMGAFVVAVVVYLLCAFVLRLQLIEFVRNIVRKSH